MSSKPRLTRAERRANEQAEWSRITNNFVAAKNAGDLIVADSAAHALVRFQDQHDDFTGQALVAADWIVQNADAVKAARVHTTLRVTLPTELERAVKSYQAEIDRFTKKLGEDPFSALEWSRDAFQSAARMKVASEWLAFVQSDRAAEMSDADLITLIQSEARSRVMRKARYLELSTSPTSNLAADYLRCAMGEFAEMTESLGEGFVRWF